MLGDLQEEACGGRSRGQVPMQRSARRSCNLPGQTRNLLHLNVRQSLLGTRLWTLAEFIGSGLRHSADHGGFGGREVLRGEITAGSARGISLVHYGLSLRTDSAG